MTASSKVRNVAMDRVRSIVICLVVFHHSIIPYSMNAVPWWYVKDSVGSIWFSIILMLDDTFLIPTLFFVAGYFLPNSLQRNGRNFVVGKAVRLIVPMVLGIEMLGPIIAYTQVVTLTGANQSYVDFWLFHYLNENVQQFHFWFLGVLFIFSCLAWLLRRWLPPNSDVWKPVLGRFQMLNLFGLYLLASLLGALVVAVSTVVSFEQWDNYSGILVFQPTRLPIYVGFYLLGLLAASAGWQLQKPALPRLRLLLPLAMVTSIALIVSRAGSHAIPIRESMQLGNFLYPLVTLSLFLLVLHFALAFDGRSPTHGIDRASFAIYLVHLPVVVLFQFALMGSPYSPWVKAALVFTPASVLSYLLAQIMIRLPVLRSIV